MIRRMSEDDRKAIFLEVVEAEDSGGSPSEVRKEVAERHGISEDEVKAIAEEGIDKTWPPLEQCDDE